MYILACIESPCTPAASAAQLITHSNSTAREASALLYLTYITNTELITTLFSQLLHIIQVKIDRASSGGEAGGGSDRGSEGINVTVLNQLVNKGFHRY